MKGRLSRPRTLSTTETSSGIVTQESFSGFI